MWSHSSNFRNDYVTIHHVIAAFTQYIIPIIEVISTHWIPCMVLIDCPIVSAIRGWLTRALLCFALFLLTLVNNQSNSHGESLDLDGKRSLSPTNWLLNDNPSNAAPFDPALFDIVGKLPLVTDINCAVFSCHLLFSLVCLFNALIVSGFKRSNSIKSHYNTVNTMAI